MPCRAPLRRDAGPGPAPQTDRRGHSASVTTTGPPAANPSWAAPPARWMDTARSRLFGEPVGPASRVLGPPPAWRRRLRSCTFLPLARLLPFWPPLSQHQRLWNANLELCITMAHSSQGSACAVCGMSLPPLSAWCKGLGRLGHTSHVSLLLWLCMPLPYTISGACMACRTVWYPTKEASKSDSLCAALHDQRAAGARGRAVLTCTTAAAGPGARRACRGSKAAVGDSRQPAPAGAPAAAALPPAACCISRQGLLLRLRCPGFLPGLQ